MTTVWAPYSGWKYRAKDVRKRCLDIVKAVKELRETVEFDGVVLSGSSGVWLGGALQAHRSWPSKLPIMLCRKPNESSHGPLLELDTSIHAKPSRVVLIDDFIDSGSTARRVQEAVSSAYIRLVGVIEHEYLRTEEPLERQDMKSISAGVPVYARF